MILSRQHLKAHPKLHSEQYHRQTGFQFLHHLTPHGRRRVDPAESPRSERVLATLRQMVEDAVRRPVEQPPSDLADHAPINYVARLAALVISEGPA